MKKQIPVVVVDGYCQTCNRPIIYCEHATIYHDGLMARIAHDNFDQQARRLVGPIWDVPLSEAEVGELDMGSSLVRGN